MHTALPIIAPAVSSIVLTELPDDYDSGGCTPVRRVAAAASASFDRPLVVSGSFRLLPAVPRIATGSSW